MSWLKDFFGFLWNLLLEGFQWIFDLAVSIVAPLFDAVMSLIPNLDFDIQSFVNIAHIANSWVAIDYALFLVSSYIAIICAVIGAKWVKKFIPFIN